MMVKEMKYMNVCIMQSATQRSFSWKGGGYIQSTTGREKTACKECYQATKAWLKSEGVDLNLAVQPYLIFSLTHCSPRAEETGNVYAL